MAEISQYTSEKKPFIEHIRELQVRLTWTVGAIMAGSLLAYAVNEKLLAFVQQPLGQTLYYTSPAGGFSALLKLCIACGFLLAIPVALYNFYKFLEPVLRGNHGWSVVRYTLWSILLAFSGIMFAYFISLPAALHFLENFAGPGVQSLINVNEYFNFALTYVVVLALVFQLPLIILLINRIKPLGPGSMMGKQRYVILFSFILAAVLTPTPDPFNQALMALPLIALYQVSIVMVWLKNRKKTAAKAEVKPPLVPAAFVRPVARPYSAPVASFRAAPTVRRSIDGILAPPLPKRAI